MPGRAQILRELSAIANAELFLALGWHVAIASVICALFIGLRPSKRHAAWLLALPLLSVSATALKHENHFNGAALGITALTLLVLGAGLPRAPVTLGTTAEVVMGVAAIAFGFVYPHFLVGHSPLLYLLAAPVGLLPCPTLAVVTGFTLLAGGFQARAWSTTLAAVSLFYVLFGVLRLGVWLDLGLVTVGLFLLGGASRLHPAVNRQPHSLPDG